MTLKDTHKIEEVLLPHIPEDAAVVIEDVEDADEDAEDEDAEYDEYEEGEYDPVQHITQLLVTEEGLPVADVLLGIKESLDKLGKIHYKIVQLLEARQ